ncbi:MAG TPA: protein phosphatase 2C domain-containing protein [Dehalococcoidia bacterium]|nr:protein phosphatase 2C domain-containing protein [Dehalococcoidia bacterium]
MPVHFASASDVSRRRDSMQDTVDVRSLPKADAVLLTVADGMGGAAAGDVASRLAVEAAAAFLEERAAPEQDHDAVAVLLQEAVSVANAAVRADVEQNPSRAGMGTTLVLAWVEEGWVTIANVGDSRAYLWHEDELRQVSEDHSYVEERVRAGRLTREEARIHPYRNVITRVIGTQDGVEADIITRSLAVGGLVLLATDGLHGPVDDAAIATLLHGADLEALAQGLVAAANQAGGPDNIGVAIARSEA